MRFLKNLFSEKSDISAMRVMAMISLLIGGYLAFTGKDASVSIFVLAAFGGKFAQKVVETKDGKAQSRNTDGSADK